MLILYCSTLYSKPTQKTNNNLAGRSFVHLSWTQTGAFTTWRPASDADRRDADMHGLSLGYNPPYPHHRFRMRDQTCRNRQTSGMTRCTMAEDMRGKGLRQPLP